MKLLLLSALLLALLVGCGVNKDYVAEQIAASESRTDSRLGEVSDKVNQNAEQVARLQSLAAELGDKADMAINKASGFENYQIIWTGEVNFDFDSYEINATAEDILNEAGAKLESVPLALAEIVGHTDATGPKSYNLLLGEKRANSAKRFLAERFGISLYRLFIMSYGEDKPVAMPDERQAGAKNRRVTLNIWGPVQ